MTRAQCPPSPTAVRDRACAPPADPQASRANLVQQVARLPPLPRAVTAVLQALNQPRLSTEHCIGLIEQDQALAARVLRLANSAFYGVPGRVASIGQAVHLLGLRQVSGVLTAAAMQGAIRLDPCAGFSLEAYWRHALASALAARALAARAGWEADVAFLAGLLHDIGQLAMAAFQPRLAAQALALAQAPGWDVERAEQATLGVAHPALGAEVARHWGFPADLVLAIAHHHAPQAAPADRRLSLSGLVRLADAVAHAVAGAAADGATDAAANAAADAAADAADNSVVAAQHQGAPLAPGLPAWQDPTLWPGPPPAADEWQQLVASVEAGTREICASLQA